MSDIINPDDSIHVLHVDDDLQFVDLVGTVLEEESKQFRVTTATSATEGIEQLAAADIDCIVSDYDMPGRNGIEFLRTVRNDHPDLPFILFTGKGSEEVASEAISAGVSDYLQKESGIDQFTVLANRIMNLVNQYRAEAQVERERDRYTSLVNNLSNPVVHGELDGDEIVIRDVNPAFEDIFGQSADTIEGEWFCDDALPDSGTRGTAAELLTQRLRSDGELEIELHRKTVDGMRDFRVNFAVQTSDTDINECYAIFTDITASKEREREHERRFEAIFNQTYQFTGLLEPDGTLIEANEAALEFGGLTREDVIGKKVWDTYWFQVSEDTRQQAKADVQQAADGEFVRRELEVQGADRTAIIDFSVKPVTDDQGEVVLLVPEGRDITELTERKEELRKERAFTQSIFRALPDVFYAFDTDGNFLRWNDRFEEVTGYSSDEIKEMHPLDFVPEEEEAKIATGIATVTEEKRPVSVESYFETKSGDLLPYEFTGGLLKDEDGHIRGLAGIGRDISERKERERRYEAIFNQTYQFTGLMDPDGTLLEVNDTALEFGGLDREDVLGLPLWEAYWWQIDDTTPQEVREAVDRAAEGEFVRSEVEIQGRDEDIIIDFSIRPVTSEEGEVTYLIPEGRNITELKTIKQRERELQRQNRRLEEFASVISHDLRTPLTVAEGRLKLAQDICNHECLIDARNALERCQALVDDILTLTREGQKVQDLEAFELAEIAETSWRTVETADATLVIDSNRQIQADYNRLQQLLENLFENAVAHGGEGVIVSVGDLDGDRGFYVEDDGPGIPTDERELVFESGYSTSEEGTGFGLSIVQKITEAHGWDIRVTESEDGGARFELVLSENQEISQVNRTPL